MEHDRAPETGQGVERLFVRGAGVHDDRKPELRGEPELGLEQAQLSVPGA